MAGRRRKNRQLARGPGTVVAESVPATPTQTFKTLETRLELNRSVHRLDQVSPSLAPEDGVSSAIEVVK